MKPGDADGVSLFEPLHARAAARDPAGYFVPEHERHRHARLESFPFAAGEVQIAVAKAASLDPDENLARSRNRFRNLSQGQRFAAVFQKRGFHAESMFGELERNGTAGRVFRGAPACDRKIGRMVRRLRAQDRWK